MVITKLKGGLGNQLFQYAAGFAFARNRHSSFKIDVSGYEKNPGRGETSRNLDIHDFLITAPVASAKEIEGLKYPNGVISKISRAIEKKVFKQYYVDWHPNLLQKTGHVYLDGYFQSEKYFQNHLIAIFDQFTLRQQWLDPIKEITESINQSIDSVSLHVRRGDYADNPKVSRNFLVCDAKYYQRAIYYLLERMPNCKFYVFSDNVQWAKQNLVFPGGVRFVSSAKGNVGALRPSQELILMSKCHHHILSNSSFSWWGAYLNKSPSKIVLAPDVWNNGYVAQPNILPESWLRFPVSE
jgi:hypothetical protein